MSLNRLLCNCGMLFCKDNDSVGVGTSALSNVASMFFRSLLNFSNSNSNSNSSSSTNIKAINEEKIDHPTITTNTDSIDDDGILYCMPIVTKDKVKRKRKGTKAIKATRKDMKKKKQV